MYRPVAAPLVPTMLTRSNPLVVTYSLVELICLIGPRAPVVGLIARTYTRFLLPLAGYERIAPIAALMPSPAIGVGPEWLPNALTSRAEPGVVPRCTQRPVPASSNAKNSVLDF